MEEVVLISDDEEEDVIVISEDELIPETPKKVAPKSKLLKSHPNMTLQKDSQWLTKRKYRSPKRNVPSSCKKIKSENLNVPAGKTDKMKVNYASRKKILSESHTSIQKNNLKSGNDRKSYEVSIIGQHKALNHSPNVSSCSINRKTTNYVLNKYDDNIIVSSSLDDESHQKNQFKKNNRVQSIDVDSTTDHKKNKNGFCPFGNISFNHKKDKNQIEETTISDSPFQVNCLELGVDKNTTIISLSSDGSDEEIIDFPCSKCDKKDKVPQKDNNIDVNAYQNLGSERSKLQITMDKKNGFDRTVISLKDNDQNMETISNKCEASASFIDHDKKIKCLEDIRSVLHPTSPQAPLHTGTNTKNSSAASETFSDEEIIDCSPNDCNKFETQIETSFNSSNLTRRLNFYSQIKKKEEELMLKGDQNHEKFLEQNKNQNEPKNGLSPVIQKGEHRNKIKKKISRLSDSLSPKSDRAEEEDKSQNSSDDIICNKLDLDVGSIENLPLTQGASASSNSESYILNNSDIILFEFCENLEISNIQDTLNKETQNQVDNLSVQKEKEILRSAQEIITKPSTDALLDGTLKKNYRVFIRQLIEARQHPIQKEYFFDFESNKFNTVDIVGQITMWKSLDNGKKRIILVDGTGNIDCYLFPRENDKMQKLVDASKSLEDSSSRYKETPNEFTEMSFLINKNLRDHLEESLVKFKIGECLRILGTFKLSRRGNRYVQVDKYEKISYDQLMDLQNTCQNQIEEIKISDSLAQANYLELVVDKSTTISLSSDNKIVNYSLGNCHRKVPQKDNNLDASAYHSPELEKSNVQITMDEKNVCDSTVMNNSIEENDQDIDMVSIKCEASLSFIGHNTNIKTSEDVKSVLHPTSSQAFLNTGTKTKNTSSETFSDEEFIDCASDEPDQVEIQIETSYHPSNLTRLLNLCSQMKKEKEELMLKGDHDHEEFLEQNENQNEPKNRLSPIIQKKEHRNKIKKKKSRLSDSLSPKSDTADEDAGSSSRNNESYILNNSDNEFFELWEDFEISNIQDTLKEETENKVDNLSGQKEKEIPRNAQEIITKPSTILLDGPLKENYRVFIRQLIEARQHPIQKEYFFDFESNKFNTVDIVGQIAMWKSLDNGKKRIILVDGTGNIDCYLFPRENDKMQKLVDASKSLEDSSSRYTETPNKFTEMSFLINKNLRDCLEESLVKFEIGECLRILGTFKLSRRGNRYVQVDKYEKISYDHLMDLQNTCQNQIEEIKIPDFLAQANYLELVVDKSTTISLSSDNKIVNYSLGNCHRKVPQKDNNLDASAYHSPELEKSNVQITMDKKNVCDSTVINNSIEENDQNIDIVSIKCKASLSSIGHNTNIKTLEDVKSVLHPTSSQASLNTGTKTKNTSSETFSDEEFIDCASDEPDQVEIQIESSYHPSNLTRLLNLCSQMKKEEEELMLKGDHDHEESLEQNENHNKLKNRLSPIIQKEEHREKIKKKISRFSNSLSPKSDIADEEAGSSSRNNESYILNNSDNEFFELWEDFEISNIQDTLKEETKNKVDNLSGQKQKEILRNAQEIITKPSTSTDALLDGPLKENYRVFIRQLIEARQHPIKKEYFFDYESNKFNTVDIVGQITMWKCLENDKIRIILVDGTGNIDCYLLPRENAKMQKLVDASKTLQDSISRYKEMPNEFTEMSLLINKNLRDHLDKSLVKFEIGECLRILGTFKLSQRGKRYVQVNEYEKISHDRLMELQNTCLI